MRSSVNGSEQPGAARARTLPEVEAELSEAAEQMQALKAERDEVAAAVKEATQAKEPWRLEELERRGRDVRRRIEAVQTRQWGLYAERARLQLPEAEERAAAAKEEYERAHAEYLELYARVNRLGVEANNAQVRALGLRQTMEENERKAQTAGSRQQAK